jgi:myosin heavy subunit
MRKFFEEKVAELQILLNEKESERDRLLQELQVAEKQNKVNKEMTELLQQKQDQIENLKRIQSNYRKQTTSPSSSSVEQLSRLQSDVSLMKKRKADMQKELALEKKNHMQEMEKLRKVVMQKDREISKIQKVSISNADAMEKAKAMSKHRLDELTQLRKAIRDYKRGAGLDPVMVGRRQIKSFDKHITISVAGSDESAIPASFSDTIRDYFDSKVAAVVHKEATVDRLAKEWEEFLELTTQRQFPDISSAMQESLDLQIQFKIENIRKIAQRLKVQDLTNNNAILPEQDKDDSFLFDEKFTRICASTCLLCFALSLYFANSHVNTACRI